MKNISFVLALELNRRIVTYRQKNTKRIKREEDEAQDGFIRRLK